MRYLNPYHFSSQPRKDMPEPGNCQLTRTPQHRGMTVMSARVRWVANDNGGEEVAGRKLPRIKEERSPDEGATKLIYGLMHLSPAEGNTIS